MRWTVAVRMAIMTISGNNEECKLIYNNHMKGFMVKFISSLMRVYLLIVLASSGWAADDKKNENADVNLLFELAYDNFSVNANYAKGDPKCLSFKTPDLQLRMFPGIDGKGNALCLENTEYCFYKMKGNFDPRQGTVTLWVNPQNWKTGVKKFQSFFRADLPQNGYTMKIYKEMWPNWISFNIAYKNAPGTVKEFTTRVPVDEVQWTGKWHRIDATWNEQGMRLYIDGVSGANNMAKSIYPECKFSTPVAFPEASSSEIITIGTPEYELVSPYSDPKQKTAFDEIRIYDRVLGDVEIRQGYEKYFPMAFGKERKEQIITVPYVQRGIKTDGVIDKEEWADAAVVPIACLGNFGTENPILKNAQSQAYLKYDDSNLYIGVFVNQPSTRHSVVQKDGKTWEDDSIEIMLSNQGKDKKTYHLIINSNGLIYDDITTYSIDSSWESGAVSAALCGEKNWSMEVAIPIKALGGKESVFGKTFKGNVCVTYYVGDKPVFSGWNQLAGQSYIDERGFGKIIFGKTDEAVRMEKFESPESGKLDIRANIVPAKYLAQGTLNGLWEAENGEKTVYSEIAGKDWKTTLPSGMQMVQLEGVNKGDQDLFFRYGKYFYVNMPMEIKYACRAEKKIIEVDVDLSNSGQETLAAIRDGGVNGTVRIVAENGAKEYSVQQFKIDSLRSKVTIPFPQEFPEGRYLISVLVAGKNIELERSALFRVPDLTPYKVRLGLDRSVPAPWTPVEQKAEGIFNVLGREYRFNGAAFPEQITADGEGIIAEPPKMFVDTGSGATEVKWAGYAVKSKYEDVITLCGKGNAGTLKFDWEGELWFDGLYKLDLKMSPEKAIEMKSLFMTWKVKNKFGKFVLSQLYNKWEAGRIDLRFEPTGGFEGDFIVWLTGHKNGLLWWPKSNANWVNGKDEKQISVVQTADAVEVRVNIISRPALLNKPAEYTMAFLGTPSRTPPANFRNLKFESMHKSQYGSIGWAVFNNKPYADDTSTPASHIPRDLKEYQAFVKDQLTKKGKLLLAYGMPAQISPLEAEYDYFIEDWKKFPGYSHGFEKCGVKSKLYPCCGHTGAADLFAWRTDKLLKDVPGIGGIYYDIAQVEGCENPLHGCGGIDAFGKPYMSSGALSLRNYLIRIYKILHKNNKILLCHAHSRFSPIAHAFADLWYPGEQYFAELPKNYQYFYCEGISPEVYQSELAWEPKGVAVAFLPQYGRAAELIPDFKQFEKDFKTNPEWAIRTMTPLMLNDIDISPSAWISWKPAEKWWDIKDKIRLSDAKFTGYWDNSDVKSGSQKIFVSYYSWNNPSPYERLLVVANMGREELPAALDIDGKILGSGKLKFTDLWEDREISVGELKTIRIPGNHFLLVGISR